MKAGREHRGVLAWFAALGKGRERPVMTIAVYGDLDEPALVAFARQLEDGLLAEPEISRVELSGVRRPEIRVQVPQDRLRAFGLTLGAVAVAIRAGSLDVPAGTLRTPASDVRLETGERRERGSGFGEVPIVTGPGGARVRLADLATVQDAFEDTEREAYFDGQQAVLVSVFSAEDQSPTAVADATRRFVEREQRNLPPTVRLTPSRDRSVEYRERLELMLRNGAAGLLLVVLALGLFILPAHLAFTRKDGPPRFRAFAAFERAQTRLRARAEIELPSGTPVARTREVAFEIERAARQARAENGEEDILIGVFIELGEHASNEAEVSVMLVPQSQRAITGEAFANLWRAHIDAPPDLESIFFDYLVGPGGSASWRSSSSSPSWRRFSAATPRRSSCCSPSRGAWRARWWATGLVGGGAGAGAGGVRDHGGRRGEGCSFSGATRDADDSPSVGVTNRP